MELEHNQIIVEQVNYKLETLWCFARAWQAFFCPALLGPTQPVTAQ